MSRATLQVLEDFVSGGGDTPWLMRYLLTGFQCEFCTLASMIVIESSHRVGVDGWILVEGECPIEERCHSWVEKECADGTLVVDLIAHQFGEFRAGFGD